MNLPPLLPEPVPPLPTVPATTPAPIVRWRWWIHLLLIAAYPLLIGVVGLGSSEAAGPALSSGAKGLLISCAVQLTVFGLVMGLAW